MCVGMAACSLAGSAQADDVPEHHRLSQEAIALYREGKAAEAIVKSERALEVAKRATGAQSADTADQLWNLGKFHEAVGHYAEARDLFLQAEVIYEKHVGREHLYMAEVLMGLTRTHANLNEPDKAKSSLDESIAILEKLAESDRAAELKLARHLYTGASVYELVNRRDEAAAMIRRGIAILEEQGGAEQVEVGQARDLLAKVLYDKGDYRRSIAESERVLAIYRAKFGDGHASAALPIHRIASALQGLGRYAKAEARYREALALTSENLGNEHPRTAGLHADLCSLYLLRGDLVAAVDNGERAVAIFRDSPQRHELGLALNSLGAAYRMSGQLHAAEATLRRALAIRQEFWGEGHPVVAGALVELGRTLAIAGKRTEARELAERATAVLRQAHGEGHVLTAGALNLAASFEEPPERLKRLEEILAIRRSGLPPSHPDIAETLFDIARIHVVLGDPVAARAAIEEANPIREQNLSLLLGVGTEAQKLQAIDHLNRETGVTITLHLSSLGDDDVAARLAYDAVLQRKGRVIDALVSDLEQLRGSGSPADDALLDELAAVRTELASHLLGTAETALDAESSSEQVAAMRAQMAELERAIAQRSAAFLRGARAVSTKQVQATLPPDAALVDYVVYQPFSGESSGPPPRYAAYVVTHEGPPRGIDLGAVSVVERLAARAHDALARPERDPTEASRELDALVMEPVRRLVGSRRVLYVSPDQKLNLVPFEALVDEEGQHLIERFRVRYVTSGRELVRPDRPTHDGPTVLIGAPAFGPTEAAQRGRSSLGLMFPSLPAAEQEIALLAELLHRPRALVGAAATEEAFKALVRPRVLHVATHGFFVGDEGQVGAGTRGVKTVRLSEEDPSAMTPLLRSGLALAGANEGRSGAEEDGVLTALEASSLDLRGTELVVLSACETGLGAAHSGDGVYGLRRAVTLAGAETLVMSLWKVDDEATRDLMVGFYRRLSEGAGRADALRDVQLAMRKDPTRSHPYYWASFIVSGDDAPLDVTQRPLVGQPTHGPPPMDPSAGCACEVAAGYGRSSSRSGWLAVVVSLLLAARRRARREQPSDRRRGRQSLRTP